MRVLHRHDVHKTCLEDWVVVMESFFKKVAWLLENEGIWNSDLQSRDLNDCPWIWARKVNSELGIGKWTTPRVQPVVGFEPFAYD